MHKLIKRSSLDSVESWIRHYNGTLKRSTWWYKVTWRGMLSVTDSVRTKENTAKEDEYCLLILSGAVDYQHAITTRANLYARNYHALLGYKMYSGRCSISTFSFETRGGLINFHYLNPSDKNNMLWQTTDHLISILNIGLYKTLLLKHPFS